MGSYQPNYEDKTGSVMHGRQIELELDVDRLEVMKKRLTNGTMLRSEEEKAEPKFGAGSDEVYKGNWFAFSSLMFLVDKMKLPLRCPRVDRHNVLNMFRAVFTSFLN